MSNKIESNDKGDIRRIVNDRFLYSIDKGGSECLVLVNCDCEYGDANVVCVLDKESLDRENHDPECSVKRCSVTISVSITTVHICHFFIFHENCEILKIELIMKCHIFLILIFNFCILVFFRNRNIIIKNAI